MRNSVLWAYGLPGLPLAMASLPVYIFIPTLYAQDLGISLGAIGVVLFIARFVDAISDPLLGLLSDRTNSRFGRRKPWMVLAMPFMLVTIFQLFDPPDGATITHLAVWSIVLSLVWTAMILPYNAWAAELSDDYHERTQLTSAREAMVLVGTMIAAAFPVVMSELGYPSLREHTGGIALFVLFTLPLTVLVISTLVPDRQIETKKHVPWRKGFAILAGNKPFRRLLTTYFINAAANGIPATLFILFVTHRLEMPESYGLLLFAYFLAGLVGIPVWYGVSKMVGKSRAWCLAMLTAIAAFIWTPFVVGPGDFMEFLLITLISGCAVGADLSLPSSLQADIVDIDRLETGERRTGLYFAVWGIATKLALGLSAGAAFIILGWVGFDAEIPAGGANNGGLPLSVLTMLYALVPVVFKLIAVALMWNFPLGQQEQEIILRRLRSPASKT